MSHSDQLIVALLVAILARTFLPPLGSDSLSNRSFVLLTGLAAMFWVGWEIYALI